MSFASASAARRAPRASRLIPSRLAPLAPSPHASRPSPHSLTPHASHLTPHSLTPLAPRLAPRAPAPAIAGPGAAPLRPSTLSSHVQRATFNLQPLAPLAPSPRTSRLAPHASRHGSRCRSGRSAAAPLHVVVPRATCNVQPSTPRAPRLIPSRLTPLASHNTCTGSISTIHPGGMRSARISGVGSRARRMRCQR
jgi:hypothetical protein